VSVRKGTCKLLDNSVENDTFKVPALGMPDEILDSFGCMLWEETTVYVTHRSVDYGCGTQRLGCLDRLGRCNSLFFSCRLFVEHVTVSRYLVVSVFAGGNEHNSMGGKNGGETYSGSSRVNI
jgi:hypothetical protein